MNENTPAISGTAPAPHAMSPAMSMGNYLAVFGGLVVLTLLTVGLSFVELHQWHAWLGLAIASAKAALVILFFMHVLHSHRLIWSVIIAALLWLGILMVLTLADNLTRAWLSY